MPISGSYILVVDDDKAITDQISSFFKTQEYKFQTFNSSLDAIDALRKIAFDFIIADLNMPYLNGSEFVRLVRSLPEYKHTPIIVISERGVEADLIETLNCGADDFLKKPLKEELFMSKVKANFQKIAFKKEIYRKNLVHLTTDQGVVFYLSSEKKDFYHSWDLEFKLIYIDSTTSFEEKSEIYNCWAIIIEEDCEWALDYVHKLQSDLAEEAELILMTKDQKFYGYDNIFYLDPDKPTKEKNDTILYLLKRERQLKRKYVRALQLAAEKTPFISNRFTEKKAGNFHITAFHESLDKVPGGDFYEIFNLGNEKKLIFIGDVMGKNWDAWFYVPAYLAYVRSAIKLLASKQDEINIKAGDFLEFLNKSISKDLSLSGIFCTLACIIVDSNNDNVELALAGGTPPIFFNALNNTIETKMAKGLILGLRETSTYETIEIPFSKNSKMLLYTDGYSEAYSATSQGIIKTQGVEETFHLNAIDNQLSILQIENELINRYDIKRFDDDRTAILLNLV